MSDGFFRFVRYFKKPIVLCGTAQYAASLRSPEDSMLSIPESFYGLFGKRQRGNIRRVHEMLDGGKFLDEVLVAPLPDIPRADRKETRLFDKLLLPRLREKVHVFTPELDSLLEEGKNVVPYVLSTSNIDKEYFSSEYNFSPTASAEGEGFTCTVYRRPPSASDNFNVPVYIIAGDLNISVDEFHALACDTDFRGEWDDQFHHVESQPIDSKISLLNWVVKWPWPLSARSYEYLLAPHALDDGTKLVLAASVERSGEAAGKNAHSAVPVRAYFGITAAKPIGEKKCRYCIFYFDDPRLPGKMPAWVESYVAKTLLPSFPKKIIQGAQKYPQDRLQVFSNLSVQ